MGIHANFDTAFSSWSVVNEFDGSIGLSFSKNKDLKVDIVDFSFGYNAKVDGVLVLTRVFPAANETYKEVESGYLFSNLISANPGQKIEVVFWCKNLNGFFQCPVEILIPFPEKPFPSWIWNGADWDSPVNYPDYNYDFLWDEELQQWILLKDDNV